jgi:hypothetical protein
MNMQPILRCANPRSLGPLMSRIAQVRFTFFGESAVCALLPGG